MQHGGEIIGRGSHTSKRASMLYLAIVVLVAAVAALAIWLAAQQTIQEETPNAPQTGGAPSADTPPETTHKVVTAGRTHIWDIGFLPDKTILFTERGGTLNAVVNGTAREVARIADVYAHGEGGLMGLAIDPDFAQNRFIYTCLNSTAAGLDVRVARWRLADNLSSLAERNDIVTGIPSNQSGRHSGCRIAFGPDGYLWIATGDAAIGSTPQDPASLGGKILRVDREGQPVAGNLGDGFDPRIYSYGHRNSQGIAFFEAPANGVPGVSVEHGPDINDQLNPLRPGNFGWDPVPGYNESVPMTDTQKYPNAVDALWSSGRPTLAPSGSAVLKGDQWQAWEGGVVVAMLRSQHLRLFQFDSKLRLTSQQEIFNGFGRLRAATLGPDGALYIGTSNGSDDKIIRLEPQTAQ